MERLDNGIRSDFVYLGTKPIARITSNSPSYIFVDYQNTPLFETDSSGTVTRAPVYLGYGNPDQSGVDEIPGYAGGIPDQETGEVYLGARYTYHARFLSPDPAPLDPTNPVGLNRYAYANDNPVRFSDPFGLYACGSKVSSGDCNKIDSFVNKINQSLNGLSKSSSDYRTLSAVSQFLGTKNDNNGVTINAASLPPNRVAQPGGLKTIQLDMNKITGSEANTIKAMNHGMSNSDAAVIAGGEAIAHETQHLIDANRRLFDNSSMQMVSQGFPTTKVYETATERRAFGVAGAFGRGLGVDAGYSTPAQVEGGVQTAVSVWCTNNPACQ